MPCTGIFRGVSEYINVRALVQFNRTGDRV